MNFRHEQLPELPAPPLRILSVAVLALVAGVGVVWCLNRPTGPECVGVLHAHTTQIVAPADGILVDLLVQEGEDVDPGTPVARLLDARLENEIRLQEQQVASAESELVQARAEAELELAWRRSSLDKELCELQLRSASFLKEKFDHELRHTMLADMLEGRSLVMLEEPSNLFESLMVEKRASEPARMVTVLQMEAAANAAEVSGAQVEICEQQLSRLKTLQSALPEQVRKSAGVDVAEARVAELKLKLKQLEMRREALAVPSTAVGTVGLLKVDAGDHLAAGQPIVELLDTARREIIVHVPSQDIAAFVPKSSVAIQFPGAVRRTGRVVHVAPQATRAVEGDPLAPAHVRVKVEQTGAVWPTVPIGTQVLVEPAD